METSAMRTYAIGEDPYHIKRSLEQFLKEKNTAALMEVLMDDHEIGTHAAVTRGIMLSSYVKSTPDIQQELLSVLLDFDLASLKTSQEVREMISFSYFSLSEDRKGKDLQKLMPLLWSKRIQDFRAGKFQSLSLAAQGDILINASHGASALSEDEIESLIELKTAERGGYWAALMYTQNIYKALDFIAEKGIGKHLLSFVIMHRTDEPQIQIDAIDYIYKTYDHLLDDKIRDSLNKRREWAVEKIEKKE